MKITFRKLIVNEVYLTDEDRNDAYINARFGAVSYIPPLSFVMLLSARRKSKFVNFHAKQAFIIMLIMLIGYLFSGWISWVIEAVAWLMALVGFFFAGAGKYIEIPGVIQLLSFHIIKDSPVVKKVRSARAAEINDESKTSKSMKSKNRNTIIGLLFFLAFVFFVPTSVQASELHYFEDTFTLPADETIEDNLIINASEVYIDGKVDGDLFFAGDVVTVNGEVTGDVFGVGSVVSFGENSNIWKTVRLSGSDLSLNGKIGENVYLWGYQILLKSAVGGEARITGTNFELNSDIKKDLYLDVVNANFVEGASIQGDLNYNYLSSNANLDNVTISGSVNKTSKNISFIDRLMANVSKIFLLLVISFLFGLVMLWIYPNVFVVPVQKYSDKVGLHFIRGIGVSVILSIIAIILLFGMFTLPIGLMMIVCLALMIFVGHIIFSYWLGLKVTNKSPNFGVKFSESSLTLLTGLTIYYILQLIPVIGLLVKLWATATGVGILMIVIAEFRKKLLSSSISKQKSKKA